MLALDQRSRGAILASSASCFLAAVAISPLSARTESATRALPSIVAQAYVPPAPLPATVKPSRDPFVASSDDDGEAVDSAARNGALPATVGSAVPAVPNGLINGRAALPPNAGAGNTVAMISASGSPGSEPSVRAVIVGVHPYAVIDEGTATRLVGIGGAFAGQHIVDISLAGVSLANGERVALSSASATPPPFPVMSVKPQSAVVPYLAPSGSPGAAPSPAQTPIAQSAYENYQSIQTPAQSGTPLQPLQNQFGYGQPSYGEPGYRPPAAASPNPSATTATNFEQAF